MSPRDFIVKKSPDGAWVAISLDPRARAARNVLALVDAIVARQAVWLDGGELAPLTLQDVADDSGLHTATICRQRVGRTLHTPRGSYPLYWFFSGEVGGTSVRSVQSRIADLLDRWPDLSDSEITDVLVSQGVEISRRTVSKYRLVKLGIPSSFERGRR